VEASLDWVWSVAIVFGGVVLVAAIVRQIQSGKRYVSVQGLGEVLAEATDIALTMSVDKTVSGVFRPGKRYRAKGHMVLLSQRLVLATHEGRVLDLQPTLDTQVRSAGPRRLVLEGPHPSGKARVRAELILDNEAHWAAQISAQIQPDQSE